MKKFRKKKKTGVFVKREIYINIDHLIQQQKISSYITVENQNRTKQM